MAEEGVESTDEVTAALMQTAAVLADFYKALRDSGVPDELSFELVADYHRECILAWDYDPEL